jgi:general secretion pathway protein C
VRRSPFAVTLFALAACAAPTAPPPAVSDRAPALAAEPAPRGLTLNLRDVTVEDVLSAVSAAAGQPVAVDPDAQPVVRCARMTLLSQTPVAGDELAKLVAEALDGSALALTRADSGAWMVRRRPGVPLPASCEVVARVPQDPPTDASAAPARSADPAEVQRVVAGIRRVSDREAEMTQSALDRFLQNTALLTGAARVVPVLHNGTARGMKLFGIRPDGVMAALGFQNGDTVITVDKQAIASPEAALEVYSRVRHAKALVIGLERAGKPHELTVRIVPDAKSPQR